MRKLVARKVREFYEYYHTVTCGECRPLVQHSWRGKAPSGERYYCRSCGSEMIVRDLKGGYFNEAQRGRAEGSYP